MGRGGKLMLKLKIRERNVENDCNRRQTRAGMLLVKSKTTGRGVSRELRIPLRKKEGIFEFCIWGREIYDSGNKKGMVGCNYGGRYATGKGSRGRGRCDLRLYKRLVSTQK